MFSKTADPTTAPNQPAPTSDSRSTLAAGLKIIGDLVTTGAVADAERVLPSKTSTYVQIPGGHHHLVLDHAEQCAALIENFAVTSAMLDERKVLPQ